MPNPITAVAIQMMAPVARVWLSRRKARAMPAPARVPMAKGQKVLRMAEADSAVGEARQNGKDKNQDEVND